MIQSLGTKAYLQVRSKEHIISTENVDSEMLLSLTLSRCMPSILQESAKRSNYFHLLFALWKEAKRSNAFS